MKKALLILLCASAGVYAESRALPPVIDNSSYPGGSAYNAATPSNNAMYEILGRLEQMQQEVQELRGMVEEQSQTILDLKQRQGNIYSDLDQRIELLSGGPNQTPSAVGVNNETGQVINDPSGNVAAQDNEVSPEGNVMTDDAAVIDEPVRNEKELYMAAYELLRNGHNTRAISSFKSFLTEFPKGEYADNAQYWLGEAYKVNQDLISSKKAFTKVVTDYPNSSKVSDALLKLGYIELEQNNIAKARDYLKRVTTNHPDTTAAHLAKKKLTQMGYQQF